MRIFKRTKPRPVIGLPCSYDLVETYYRCSRKNCPGSKEKPLKTENTVVAPFEDFDYDVMAKVADLRWQEHLTYQEIIDVLKKRHDIEMSLGTVETILKTYEIGCAKKYGPWYIEKIKAFGGVILTIDGMNPLKGHDVLYVAYDYTTGLTLGSRILRNQKEETIIKFLQEIKIRIDKELNVKILGIITDALVAQRKAIEVVFPGIPHCLCHFHFYKLVLDEPKKADSRLVTAIRSFLRGMYDVKKLRETQGLVTQDEPRGNFVVHVVEALFTLSNWSRKPKDPCFTGLELYNRVKNIDTLLAKASDNMNKDIISDNDVRIIGRLHEKLTECFAENVALVDDLEQIKVHLGVIKDVLSNVESSETEGLQSLELFCTNLEVQRMNPVPR
jgi:hypothetical protein